VTKLSVQGGPCFLQGFKQHAMHPSAPCRPPKGASLAAGSTARAAWSIVTKLGPAGGGGLQEPPGDLGSTCNQAVCRNTR
jgi:hypothetical protein